MAQEQLTNGFATTLNGALNNSQTTATLTSATGAPIAPFRMLITAEGGNVDEIIYVGARSGTGLSSIVRAAEPIADGTQVAVAHSSGATITQVLTVKGLQDLSLGTGTIGAKVYNSGTQSVATGADRIITFNSEDWDTDGFHDTSTNTGRMTIPAGLGGKYLLTGHLWGISTGSDAHFRVNGTNLYSATRFVATAGEGFTWTTVLDLVGGDYVEVTLNPDSGSITVGHASARNAQCDFTVIKLDSGRAGQGIGARVRRVSGNVSIGNNTLTAITFNAEDWDTDGFHDTGSNTSRLTIPTGLSGKYIVGGTFYTDVTPADAVIALNGSTSAGYAFQRYPGGGSSIPAFTITTIMNLSAGDYVELYARTTGGSGNVLFDSGVQSPSFWIAKIDSSSPTTIGAWISWTPTWASSGTQPTLGNGVLTGRYKLLDSKTAIVKLHFVRGSSSSNGTGQYQFTGLPFTTAAYNQVMNGWLLDSGTRWYILSAYVEGSGTILTAMPVADSGGDSSFTAGTPITLATDDEVDLAGILELA